MSTPHTPDATLATLLHTSRRPLVAQLVRRLGLAQLALAEDAVQAAALQALQRWPGDGVPEQPRAWLARVALHHAIDHLRHIRPEQVLPEEDIEPGALPSVPAPTHRLAGELGDDELALLFAACHPAVPLASQVALALRAVAGLELQDIAPALFTTPGALAQRLARARQVLAGQSLALPGGHELPPRREAVLTALMLMFTHGQRASGRQESASDTPPSNSQDPLALCWEAIRLARALAAHPHAAHADADALAALLLLHGARLTGRLDEHGDIVPLPGQPRDRWDTGLVRLGLAHLQAAQRGTALSRWHVLAGIAAEHAVATDYASTDWAAIVAWYQLLLKHDDSPAPRLGHAIALAESGLPGAAERAVSLLQALLPQSPATLKPHTLAATSSALHKLGRVAEARQTLEQALACARPGADARLLHSRLQEMPAH